MHITRRSVDPFCNEEVKDKSMNVFSSLHKSEEADLLASMFFHEVKMEKEKEITLSSRHLRQASLTSQYSKHFLNCLV